MRTTATTTVLSGIGLAGAAAAVAFAQSSRAAVLWDLTYVLEIAHRIRLGEVPYAEFIVPQPPLTFLIQAGIGSIAGPGYIWPRLYCAAVAAATVLLTWRIIFLQLAGTNRPLAGALALAAATPIVFLNGYAILPLPFYDPDCTFFIVLALWAVLVARHRGGAWRHVLAGALLVLPPLTKQNTGLATLVLVHLALALSAIGGRDRKERGDYIRLLLGTTVTLSAVAAGLHAWVGLGDFYRWTVEYAAARRLPGLPLLMIPFAQAGTWIMIGCAIAGYLLARVGKRWTVLAGLSIMGAPAIVAARTMVRWGLLARSHYVWGFGSVVGGAAAVVESARTGWRFESSLPIVAVGVANAAFASQGVFDSSYGVWPLLMIALAPLAARLVEAAPARRALTITSIMIATTGFAWLGYRHATRHERLGFVNLTGPVQTATLPAIRGLAVPGTHIADFERLIARTNEIIPPTDGVLAFPGEDPFFVASGRRPRLPIVLFDDTAMPFDRARLRQMLHDRSIRWVVVKEPLQLRNPPWSDMYSFMMLDLPVRYEEIEAIPRYRIYRLRSQGSPAR